MMKKQMSNEMKKNLLKYKVIYLYLKNGGLFLLIQKKKKSVIGDPSKCVNIRASSSNHFNTCLFISQIESKNFKDAEFDDFGFYLCKN